MTTFAAVGIPETLPRRRAPGHRAPRRRRRMRDLLTDRVFVAPVARPVPDHGRVLRLHRRLVDRAADASSGSAPRSTPCCSRPTPLGMVLASVAFRLLVVRTGAVVLRTIALTVATCAGFVLFAFCLLAPDHPPPLPLVWAPLAVMLAGLGMFLPASTVIVQARGPSARRHGRRARRWRAVLRRRAHHAADRPARQPDRADDGVGHRRSSTRSPCSSPGGSGAWCRATARQSDVVPVSRSSSASPRNAQPGATLCLVRPPTPPRRTSRMTQTVDALVTTGPSASLRAEHHRAPRPAPARRGDRHRLRRHLPLRHPPGARGVGPGPVPDGAGPRDRRRGPRGRPRGHEVRRRRPGRRRLLRGLLPRVRELQGRRGAVLPAG